MIKKLKVINILTFYENEGNEWKNNGKEVKMYKQINKYIYFYSLIPFFMNQ